MRKKHSLLFYLFLASFGFTSAQNAYYQVDSFDQTDNTEKTSNYKKLTVDEKNVKLEIYDFFDATTQARNYDILEQKTNEINEKFILVKRIGNESMDGEVEGDLFTIFVMKPSSFHEEVILVAKISDIDEKKIKENYAKNELSEYEEEPIFSNARIENYFVPTSFFEETQKLKAFSEKTSEKNLITLLEKMKLKITKLKAEGVNIQRILENDAFMIAALVEAGYNGFASKSGFRTAFRKYKDSEKVKKLVEEMQKIAK